MTLQRISKNQLLNQVKIYLAYLQYEKKLSVNTVNSYWHDLRMFIDYIVSKYPIKNFNNIKSKYIRDYISSLSAYTTNKKSSSISRAISSIKSFFKYLIQNEYIHPNKVCINGGSAGGLLIGAVINMNPELFSVAVLEVPFVDCLTTMLDPTIPLNLANVKRVFAEEKPGRNRLNDCSI